MEKFNIKNGLSVGSNKLDIIDATGSLSATSITLSGQYTLPLTDGTAQQIIETDGTGNLSFVENTALTTMNSNSGGWESTKTTVNSNSADWSYVAANSAETDPVFSSWAQSVSSNYDSTYTTVQTNSADWAPPSVSFDESSIELTVGNNITSLSALSSSGDSGITTGKAIAMAIVFG